MVHALQALHEPAAFYVEDAPGRAFPQMEARFSDVSISVDIVVKDEKNTKTELPTLPNEVAKAIRGCGAKKHTINKRILKSASGVFKPGTITLVLGQPGSGKSTLLKLLSGRFPVEKNVTVEGEVTYNRTPANELQRRLPQFVSYVAQRDRHYPSLTVKETLEFAHTCAGESSLAQDAHYSASELDTFKGMSKHHPDNVIQQLGLDNCQNTIVGDAMRRGVSGGERKRVTTGEMAFGNKLVLMMDEISTGLDSAATFDIISTQRRIAKDFSKTVVISLLQPSPEVFALFDDVLILNEGHIGYHGPRQEVLGYFESLGFKCPPSRDAADFLLDLGTDKQAQYEASPIPSSNVPRLGSEYAGAFTRSAIYERMMEELRSPVHPSAQHIDHVPEFHQTFWGSTLAVVLRQIKLTRRDTAFLVGRSIMVILMALLYSSLFYQLEATNAQLVMGVLFNTVLFTSVGQLTQIPVFMAAREVFYKQRRANFFRTASFVLSNSVSQLPLAVAETLVFGSIVYWMCGCASTPGVFVLFELAFTFGAWFFFLSCASPDLNVANPISLVSILLFVVFGGFVITKDQIPVYLLFLYWLNPILRFAGHPGVRPEVTMVWARWPAGCGSRCILGPSLFPLWQIQHLFVFIGDNTSYRLQTRREQHGLHALQLLLLASDPRDDHLACVAFPRRGIDCGSAVVAGGVQGLVLLHGTRLLLAHLLHTPGVVFLYLSFAAAVFFRRQAWHQHGASIRLRLAARLAIALVLLDVAHDFLLLLAPLAPASGVSVWHLTHRPALLSALYLFLAYSLLLALCFTLFSMARADCSSSFVRPSLARAAAIC